MRSRFLPAALLLASLALPTAVFAQDAAPATSGVPIVITAAPIPVWREVPPSTDPYPVGPSAVAVKGLQVIRGAVLHGEGDLVLVSLGRNDAVVRLPGGQLDAGTLPAGSLLEVVGMPTADGIMNSQQVTIWPATS